MVEITYDSVQKGSPTGLIPTPWRKVLSTATVSDMHISQRQFWKTNSNIFLNLATCRWPRRSVQENCWCHNHIPSVMLLTLAFAGWYWCSWGPSWSFCCKCFFSAKLTLNNQLPRRTRLVQKIFALFQSKIAQKKLFFKTDLGFGLWLLHGLFNLLLYKLIFSSFHLLKDNGLFWRLKCFIRLSVHPSIHPSNHKQMTFKVFSLVPLTSI